MKLRHIDTAGGVERYKDKCYETIALRVQEKKEVIEHLEQDERMKPNELKR